MPEIGSEFWLEHPEQIGSSHCEGLFAFGDDWVYLFSGRTAIDFVLNDIQGTVDSAYLPSYCCKSMLQPFIERGVKLYFYDVVVDGESKGLDYVIDFTKNVDLYFAMSYFGYRCTVMDDPIRKFKERGILTVEDITHRFLSKDPYCEDADYLIGSMRKWFPLPTGGLAVKTNGKFREQNLTHPSGHLVDLKIGAMQKKADYITQFHQQPSGNRKQEFMDLFSEFDKGLCFDYKQYTMDSLSRNLISTIDLLSVQTKRRLNARYIYNKLQKFEYIRPLIPEPDFGQDGPLFVPILVENGNRDRLQSHLVRNSVFCPVHWPQPREVVLNPRNSVLYSQELSLVCDQRYSIKQLERQICLLREFETIK